MRIIICFIFSVILLASSDIAYAYPSDSNNTSNPKYQQAVDYINNKEYKKAIPLLTEVVASDTNNADAYNYLGYSYRQLGTLDDSFKFYQKALSIDPNHKGANEYLGELYLMQKELTKAEGCLDVLKKACPSGCVEYTTLLNRINAYKKN